MSETLVPLGYIRVGKRYREDLGDLSDLMESMADVGLLNPIGVTPKYALVTGHRRLESARQLGWSKIAVRICTDRDDALTLLKMERDENKCRKDMTPSEWVTIGAAIEELERPKARARQGTRNDLTSGSPEPNVRTDDIVADALGVSSPTYKRAKHIVKVASDPKAPPEVREVAAQAQAEMDATGRVRGPYDRLRAVEKGEAPASLTGLKLPPAQKIIDKTVSTLGALRVAFESTDFSGCELTEDQARELTNGIRALQRLRRALSGGNDREDD